MIAMCKIVIKSSQAKPLTSSVPLLLQALLAPGGRSRRRAELEEVAVATLGVLGGAGWPAPPTESAEHRKHYSALLRLLTEHRQLGAAGVPDRFAPLLAPMCASAMPDLARELGKESPKAAMATARLLPPREQRGWLLELAGVYAARWEQVRAELAARPLQCIHTYTILSVACAVHNACSALR